jgi:activating signal cointegrator 1
VSVRRPPAGPGEPDLNALSIYQPWASMLIIGARAYDVQHQPTFYRGEVAIFTPYDYPPWARQRALEKEFVGPLSAAGLEPWALPRGVFLGLANLVDVIPIERDNVVAGVPVCSLERWLGDYRAGRYAYRYERIRRLREPIGHRGRGGLFRWRPLQPLVFTERPADPR